jgi:hypothetical protein
MLLYPIFTIIFRNISFHLLLSSHPFINGTIYHSPPLVIAVSSMCCSGIQCPSILDQMFLYHYWTRTFICALLWYFSLSLDALDSKVYGNLLPTGVVLCRVNNRHSIVSNYQLTSQFIYFVDFNKNTNVTPAVMCVSYPGITSWLALSGSLV